jgi:hypothetical protein
MIEAEQASKTSCYIAFQIADKPSVLRLKRVVSELTAVKADLKPGEAATETRDDQSWRELFDASDLENFWSPSEAEEAEWRQFWADTPVETRWSPNMTMPTWTFESMIRSLLDCDYDLLGIVRIGTSKAILDFLPRGYPYGGTDSLRMLVRSFGHSVIGFNDGTGYENGDPENPRWQPHGGV